MRRCTLDELVVEDEASLRHVALYASLKEELVRAKYEFRVLPAGSSVRHDRALFLNLTYWAAASGGDVLVDERVPADVIAHVAWHHLASRAIGPRASAKPSVDALFLGEAIASAFDVYLVGRLLGRAPRSAFLKTQVPAMAESAEAAGLSARGFARMLTGIAEDPDRAFADLRELLSDASATLFRCRTGDDAHAALAGLEGHRFAPLLHRYELSNWILYARAYGAERGGARARAVDRALRSASVPLDWLASRWLASRGAERPRPQPVRKFAKTPPRV
jgi:hypothetical protein